MDVKLMANRQRISALAWEKARWRDGRRVIVAPLRSDMAMQGPTCRVMPSEPRRTRAGYIQGREPHEEAIEMTWDQAAAMLMQPIAMFGVDLD